jgi:hypothetical protein
LNDRDSEKLDRIATDVAVTAAVQEEMSKRLTEQADSVKVLNDAHVNNEVAHAEIKASVASIEDLIKSIPSTIKTGLAVISVFLAVLQLALKYIG